jgi:serine/threonine-protein kinase
VAVPVLAPLPRRATGGRHLDTQPGTDPGWGSNEPTMEATVRAVPELMQTVQNPMPITSDKTEAIVPTVPEEEGGFGFFKALTITLVLAALAIGAYYYYVNYGGHAPDEPYSRPSNAPVPGQNSTLEPDVLTPAYKLEIPIQNRNAQKAREHELEGDRQFVRGEFGLAATEYKKAFGADPRSDLSLKLVEVYLQNNKIEEARHWWARHLRDSPNSKAVAHIEQALKSATSMPPPQQ